MANWESILGRPFVETLDKSSKKSSNVEVRQEAEVPILEEDFEEEEGISDAEVCGPSPTSIFTIPDSLVFEKQFSSQEPIGCYRYGNRKLSLYLNSATESFPQILEFPISNFEGTAEGKLIIIYDWIDKNTENEVLNCTASVTYCCLTLLDAHTFTTVHQGAATFFVPRDSPSSWLTAKGSLHFFRDPLGPRFHPVYWRSKDRETPDSNPTLCVKHNLDINGTPLLKCVQSNHCNVRHSVLRELDKANLFDWHFYTKGKAPYIDLFINRHASSF
jgi:hypothetical protein